MERWKILHWLSHKPSSSLRSNGLGLAGCLHSQKRSLHEKFLLELWQYWWSIFFKKFNLLPRSFSYKNLGQCCSVISGNSMSLFFTENSCNYKSFLPLSIREYVEWVFWWFDIHLSKSKYIKSHTITDTFFHDYRFWFDKIIMQKKYEVKEKEICFNRRERAILV